MRFPAPSTGCVGIGPFDLSSYVVIGYRKGLFCETASRLPNNWLKHIRPLFSQYELRSWPIAFFKFSIFRALQNFAHIAFFAIEIRRKIPLVFVCYGTPSFKTKRELPHFSAFQTVP